MNLREDYQKAVDYIESFSISTIRKNIGKNKKDPNFFINRMKYFLDLLDNPEKDFSYIHITGTAGKGTVSTMLQEVLIASGKKTGLFTSPYITTSIEKIRVGGRYISPAEFIELVKYIRPFIIKSQKGHYRNPSSFELFFAIALLYFKKQKCEWVVLEVGLGGRYDATNIITHPVVTAITNIDYDHTEILGKTLREIAEDKSGIIKPGSAFFTSEQHPNIQRLFKKTCHKIKASFSVIQHQSNYSEYNNELVKAIALYLGISEKYIDQGMQQTKMSCRFEIVQKRPLIILDGAHNRVKIQSTVSNLKNYTFEKLYIILAIADTQKDRQAILKPLLSLPYSKHIILTQTKNKDRKLVSPFMLLSLVNKIKKRSISLEVMEDPQIALKHVVNIAKKDDLILVTGSFFLAGELRTKWVSEKWILKHRKSFKK